MQQFTAITIIAIPTLLFCVVKISETYNQRSIKNNRDVKNWLKSELALMKRIKLHKVKDPYKIQLFETIIKRLEK